MAGITYTGVVPPYTVLWNTGATADTIGGLSAGTYTVTLTDALACTKIDSVTVGGGAGTVSVAITGVHPSQLGLSDGSAVANETVAILDFGSHLVSGYRGLRPRSGRIRRRDSKPRIAGDQTTGNRSAGG